MVVGGGGQPCLFEVWGFLRQVHTRRTKTHKQRDTTTASLHALRAGHLLKPSPPLLRLLQLQGHYSFVHSRPALPHVSACSDIPLARPHPAASKPLKCFSWETWKRISVKDAWVSKTTTQLNNKRGTCNQRRSNALTMVTEGKAAADEKLVGWVGKLSNPGRCGGMCDDRQMNRHLRVMTSSSDTTVESHSSFLLEEVTPDILKRHSFQKGDRGNIIVC